MHINERRVLQKFMKYNDQLDVISHFSSIHAILSKEIISLWAKYYGAANAIETHSSSLLAQSQEFSDASSWNSKIRHLWFFFPVADHFGFLTSYFLSSYLVQPGQSERGWGNATFAATRCDQALGMQRTLSSLLLFTWLIGFAVVADGCPIWTWGGWALVLLVAFVLLQELNDVSVWLWKSCSMPPGPLTLTWSGLKWWLDDDLSISAVVVCFLLMLWDFYLKPLCDIYIWCSHEMDTTILLFVVHHFKRSCPKLVRWILLIVTTYGLWLWAGKEWPW